MMCFSTIFSQILYFESEFVEFANEFDKISL